MLTALGDLSEPPECNVRACACTCVCVHVCVCACVCVCVCVEPVCAAICWIIYTKLPTNNNRV